VLIDKAVLRGIEDCIELAPLHNPAKSEGDRSCDGDVRVPGLPQVAVFDTSFHHHAAGTRVSLCDTLPTLSPAPLATIWISRNVHRFVASRYQQLLNKTPLETNIITLHLGNGLFRDCDPLPENLLILQWA